jgi:hypothetical protein
MMLARHNRRDCIMVEDHIADLKRQLVDEILSVAGQMRSRRRVDLTVVLVGPRKVRWIALIQRRGYRKRTRAR